MDKNVKLNLKHITSETKLYYNPIIDNKYEVLNVLGKGYTSKVVLALDKETQKEVAIKIYIQKNIETLDSFNKEVSLMKEAEHPNIVKILDYKQGIYSTSEEDKHIIYIVFELCENKEIFDFIKQTGIFNEKITRYYFHKLFNVIKFLHSKNIAHRDIKPENVFLNDKYDIILGDFGFAIKYEKDKLLYHDLGTDGYKSPELIEKVGYNPEKNDIFSLGITLFIMYFGGQPFENGATRYDFRYRNFYKEKYEPFWENIKKCIKNNNISEDIIKLLNGMLSYRNRFTLEEIEKSEWFKGEVCKEQELIDEMSMRKMKVKHDSFDLDSEINQIPDYVDYEIDDDKGSIEKYKTRGGSDGNLGLTLLINTLKSFNYDDFKTYEWRNNTILVDCFIFPASIKKTFFFILCELIVKYPLINFKYTDEKYEIKGVFDLKIEKIENDSNNDNNKETIKDDLIEDPERVSFMEIYIDFYNSKDKTVVQFIKGHNMSYSSYKSFYSYFKNYILKEDK